MVRFNRMFLMGLVMITISCAARGENDPYAWLEEVEGQKALDWVKERNAFSTKELEAVPGYGEAYDTILKVMDAKDRIPYPGRQGNTLYNFWKDAEHPRGLLRRTTLAEYRKTEPAWETVLDIDALCQKEGKNWVYKGTSFLYPKYDRCLVSLSRGGADAVEVREFDAVSKTFIKNGFFLPEAKSEVAWKDRDTLYVATDFVYQYWDGKQWVDIPGTRVTDNSNPMAPQRFAQPVTTDQIRVYVFSERNEKGEASSTGSFRACCLEFDVL